MFFETPQLTACIRQLTNTFKQTFSSMSLVCVLRNHTSKYSLYHPTIQHFVKQVFSTQLATWSVGWRHAVWLAQFWRQHHLLKPFITFYQIKYTWKIPSEMEVAPRYNCWHCWPCWHCWHCWHCWYCSTLLTWRIMSSHFIHICLVPIFQ